VAGLFQGILAKSFDLVEINGSNYTDFYRNDPEKYHYYESRMSFGILLTVAIGVVSAITFSLFLPRNSQDCREWAAISSWKTDKVAGINFGVLLCMVVFGLYGNIGNLAQDVEFFQSETFQKAFGISLLIYCLFSVFYRVIVGVPHTDKVEPLTESRA